MSATAVRTALHLDEDMAGAVMTPEEFDAVEEFDDSHRYELVHGILVVAPLPSDAEVGPSELLAYWLMSYREHHPQGAALDATLGERHVRTPDSRRRADRLIWAGLGRLPHTRTDPPTIVIEFASPRRRDRERDYVEKQGEYMRAGIAEYWIIDRFQRTLTVWRNSPTGPQQQVVREQEIYVTPLLPGFELPLTPILDAADRWAQAERE